jgi:hypothetical protein
VGGEWSNDRFFNKGPWLFSMWLLQRFYNELIFPFSIADK